LSKSKVKIAIPFDFDPVTGYFLNANYIRALNSLNAQPIPMIYDKDRISKVLDEVDGLLIPGGLGDLDPKLYGEEKKHKRVKIVRERCDFEFPLIEAAMKKQIPVLGICWGLQIINVFLGGSLHQHVPLDIPDSKIIHEHPKPGIASHHWVLFEQHEHPKPSEIAMHWVNFNDNSEAQKLFGISKVNVNSTHTQAINKVSDSLIEQGRAEDGIVECCKIKDYPYGWGVQWHPERLENDKIIPSFIKACEEQRG
jgi:putative glutamine amidotransferase